MGGFLSDFAQGFAEQTSATLDLRQKQKEDLDAYRKKKVLDSDAEYELYSRKKELEVAAQSRLDKERAEADARETAKFFQPRDTQTEQTQPIPSSDNSSGFFSGMSTQRTAEPKEAIYNKLAAAAAARGDEQAYKKHKALADAESVTRTTDRQPVLSLEGAPAVEQFAKEEGERLKQDGNSMYLPRQAQISSVSNTPEKTLEMRSAAKAATVMDTLLRSTADESGKSSLTKGEAQVVAQTLVKGKNTILSQEVSQEEKMAAYDAMVQLSNDLPAEAIGNSMQALFNPAELKKFTDFEQLIKQPNTQENVMPNEIVDVESARLDIRNQFRAGKLTREQAKQQLNSLKQ